MRISHIDSRIVRAQFFCASGTLRILAGVALCSTMLTTAVAAPRHDNLSDAQANYQKERENCLNGRSNQDRSTCLKEAGAAFAEAKRGRLNDDSAQYQQNATIRCQALQSENRQACERRMRGEGEVKGSVEAGGIYRELVVRQPARSSDSTSGGNENPDHATQDDRRK
jgi:hypothetical protein